MKYLIPVLLCITQCCFCSAAERRTGILPPNTRERGYTAENLFVVPDCTTSYSSPNHEKPKDRSMVYEYPVPIKDMWENGETIYEGKIYVQHKYCVLFNNGKWVEFPDIRVHGIKNDSIFYKSLTITDVQTVDEEIYKTPFDYKFDFRVNLIKVTIANHSDQDIMLLCCMYFEHYKEWIISEGDKETGQLQFRHPNIYIPARSSSVLYMRILPSYSQEFAHARKEGDLLQPKKVLDYRYEKGRDIHLQLFFFTCFYGEEKMRSSSIPFVLRYKGKLK